jgi:hypothetical protein
MNIFELVSWGGLAVGLYFASVWVADILAVNKWVIYGI